MKRNYFKNFDFTNFWDDDEYALREYVSEPPTDELIVSIEQELGYKLPGSYIELMKMHNGGTPIDTCFPTTTGTCWAEDHIAITGIYGIGREKDYSLCGDLGSRFMIEEWGYPDIGVVICDTPTAGHDMIMLDYRKCGKDGEPEVIHVAQEADYKTTFLAKDFETFIQGLQNEEVYDTSEEDKQKDLETVAHGRFSPLLSELCTNTASIANIEAKIRAICTKIVQEKGFFAFHADELSVLMYDLQFWLYTQMYPGITRERYLNEYKKIIALAEEFCTGGYAPDFITDWLDERIKKGLIIESNQRIKFTEKAISQLVDQLKLF